MWRWCSQLLCLFCVIFHLLVESAKCLPVSNLSPQWLSLHPRGGAAASVEPKVAAATTTRFPPAGGGGVGAVADSRMPSLFGAQEAEYNRFSACLAATEGLRRMRDQALIEQRCSNGGHITEEQEQKIAQQYQTNSARAIRAMGMSVERFNQLGREISKNEKLKDRIVEQAYLYRMAAMVNLDPMPLSSGSGSGGGGEEGSFQNKDKMKRFCQSLLDIEKLRANQVQRLKKSLHVDSFPSAVSISDPSLLPFLNPKVRAVVKAFPLQAEDVVKRNGLDSGDFNAMLQEVRSNPMFRWKVQKLLKQKEQQQRQQQQQHQEAVDKSKEKTTTEADSSSTLAMSL